MYTYIKITFGKIDKFPDECIMNTLFNNNEDDRSNIMFNTEFIILWVRE